MKKLIVMVCMGLLTQFVVAQGQLPAVIKGVEALVNTTTKSTEAVAALQSISTQLGTTVQALKALSVAERSALITKAVAGNKNLAVTLADETYLGNKALERANSYALEGKKGEGVYTATIEKSQSYTGLPSHRTISHQISTANGGLVNKVMKLDPAVGKALDRDLAATIKTAEYTLAQSEPFVFIPTSGKATCRHLVYDTAGAIKVDAKAALEGKTAVSKSFLKDMVNKGVRKLKEATVTYRDTMAKYFSISKERAGERMKRICRYCNGILNCTFVPAL